MNKRCTTTDIILEQALQIAKKEGIDKLSIRKIASACGIAIGSVYNYYPDKDALVTAVAESFWNNIFSDQEKLYRTNMRFTRFLEQYYSYLYAKMSPYDRSWVRDLEGKIPMQETMKLFQKVLKEDERVNPSIWNMEFLPEIFCQYVFKNIMALLQSGETNCRFFIYLLDNLLYEK
ncbi:MAG: TetR/AcrR family transcriptional regulator [Lachnospiraceae bacterium]|nr:TetR/AcrR family transcriptional regulator [Lachnospiraceae bacterium]